MRTFVNKDGYEWCLKPIGCLTSKKVSDATSGVIHFVKPHDSSPNYDVFAKLDVDYERLIQVIWILCEDQAEEAGISELQFVEGFDLDTVANAKTALAEALIDFFPNRSRGLLREGAAVAMQIAAEEAEISERRAMTILRSPEMAAVMRAAIHGKPSSSMPEFAD